PCAGPPPAEALSRSAPPGPAPLSPYTPLANEIVAVDGAAYFTAPDPADPRTGLWRTDGTVAGTTLLHAATVGCYGLRVNDHGLFFCDGTALWISDGTAAARVLDIGAVGAPERTNAGVFVYPAFINGSGGVWRSDGTASGTFPLPIPGFSTSAALGDRVLVVSSNNPFSGIWATDGSIAGTVNLGSMSPTDPDPSGHPSVAVAQGRAFFLSAA